MDEAVILSSSGDDWRKRVSETFGFMNVGSLRQGFSGLARTVAEMPGPTLDSCNPVSIVDAMSVADGAASGTTAWPVILSQTRRLLGQDVSTRTDFDQLNHVIETVAEFLGGAAFGCESNTSPFSSSTGAVPIVLSVPAFATSETWLTACHSPTATGRFPSCLTVIVPVAIVGESFSGEEVGIENGSGILNARKEQDIDIPSNNICLSFRDKNPGTQKFRLRRGDAVVCKYGTPIRLEAWASEVRYLLYCIGPPGLELIPNVVLRIGRARLPHKDSSRMWRSDEMTDPMEDVRQVDSSSSIPLADACLTLDERDNGEEFDSLFRPINVDTYFAQDREIPYERFSERTVATASETLMERVLQSRATSGYWIDLEYLRSTWFLRSMDMKYVFFLAKQMQEHGWRADEPALGVWSSSGDAFIVLGGNHRTAAAHMAGISRGRAIRWACVRVVESSPDSYENGPEFWTSLAIAIQASEPSPRDFSCFEQMSLFANWILQENGSKLAWPADGIYRTLEKSQMFQGAGAARHFASYRNRTALRGALNMIRSGAYKTLLENADLFRPDAWTKHALVDASSYTKSLDALRRCVAIDVRNRKANPRKRFEKLQLPNSPKLAPKYSDAKMQFEPVHDEETKTLGMYPNAIWVLQEDMRALIETGSYLTNAAVWFLIRHCIPAACYTQSSIRWVTNELSIAQLFYNNIRVEDGADPRAEKQRKRIEYSKYLASFETLFIPVCAFEHWSLAVVHRTGSLATIYHFDSKPGVGHLRRLDKLNGWVSENVDWEYVSVVSDIVSVACTEQTDRFSCGWHVVRTAQMLLKRMSDSEDFNSIARQWPRYEGAFVDMEIGYLKIQCLEHLRPRTSMQVTRNARNSAVDIARGVPTLPTSPTVTKATVTLSITPPATPIPEDLGRVTRRPESSPLRGSTPDGSFENLRCSPAERAFKHSSFSSSSESPLKTYSRGRLESQKRKQPAPKAYDAGKTSADETKRRKLCSRERRPKAQQEASGIVWETSKLESDEFEQTVVELEDDKTEQGVEGDAEEGCYRKEDKLEEEQGKAEHKMPSLEESEAQIEPNMSDKNGTQTDIGGTKKVRKEKTDQELKSLESKEDRCSEEKYSAGSLAGGAIEVTKARDDQSNCKKIDKNAEEETSFDVDQMQNDNVDTSKHPFMDSAGPIENHLVMTEELVRLRRAVADKNRIIDHLKDEVSYLRKTNDKLQLELTQLRSTDSKTEL
jgi:hypothetical protein